MRKFKFLSKNTPIFQYEIASSVTWVPSLDRVTEFYTLDRSNLIRQWLSEYFYGNEMVEFNRVKYFPEIDRTCEIIQTGIDTHNLLRVFTAVVRIKRSEDCYLQLELKYPI